MKYVDELLPDLMMQAPDVSDVALKRALKLAAQDFFKEVEVWRETVEKIFAIPGVNEFTLGLPRNTRIARVLSVKLDGEPLAPLESEDIIENRAVGYHITNDHPHRMQLTDKVKRGGWIALDLVLYPLPERDEIPDGLFHDFRQPLIAAALSRIYGAPGSPWFEPQLAAYFGAALEQVRLQGPRLSNNRRRGKRRTVRYGGY